MKKTFSLFLALCITVLTFPNIVSAADYGENIAPGKTVVCSSYAGEGFKPEKINDGNLSTVAATGHLILDGPKAGLERYIGVDLGEKYELNAVIVRTRRDLKDTWCRLIGGVYIANKNDFSDMIKIGEKTVAGDYGSDLEIELAEGTVARYVFITGGANAYSELEVYGKKYVPNVVGVYNDVPEKSQKAVRVVSKLGIMDGIGNSKFGAVNLVTRGEAVNIVNRIIGGFKGTYNGEFSDVTADYEYAGDIASALDHGIISRGAEFRPDDYVTSYELFAMLLRVNGFYSATKTGNWESDVLSIAANFGLTKGIDVSSGYVSRCDAATAVYNMITGKYLEVNFANDSYEKSKNSYLEDKLHVKFFEGLVTANSVTSLTAEKSESKNYIKINDTEYTLDDPTMGEELLGKAVYYLTDIHEEELIDIWVNTQKTKCVELKSEDIDSTSKTNIKTLINEKSTNYKLDSNAYYLKNGAAYSKVAHNAMAPKYGSIRLIDYNGDDVYEVVEIRQPDIISVTSATLDEDTRELTITGDGNYRKTLEYDVAYAYENGVKGALTDIKADRVVYAYVFESGKYADFEICRGSISGVVQSYSDDSLVIDGVEYAFSEYFKDNFANNITIGAVYTFGLNNEDEIVYTTDKGTYTETEALVVVTRCWVEDDGKTFHFNTYTEKGKFINYAAANKCKVDGVSLNSSFYASNGKSYFEGKPAIIKTNTAGEITSIITPASDRLALRTESIKGCYTGNAGFFNNSTFVLPTCHNTVSFKIPVDSTGAPKREKYYESIYEVTTLDKRYVKNRDTISSEENIVMYGYDDDGLPLAAITQVAYTDVEGYGVINKIENWNTVVVDKVLPASNADKETQYKISGWDLTTGKKTEFTTATILDSVVNTFHAKYYTEFYNDVPEGFRPESNWFMATYRWYADKVNSYFLEKIDSLQKGDIIRYGFENGATEASQLEVILKYDKIDDITQNIVYTCGDLPETIFSSYRLQQVKITKCGDGRVYFTLPDGTKENYALSDFMGTLLVFDGTNAKNYSVSDAEAYIGSGERALIFSTAGIHKSIIVY